MAGIVHLLNVDCQYRRQFRRERLIRDRSNPLEIFDDVELRERFRMDRRSILELVDLISPDLRYTSRRNSAILPVQQTMIALRYYATGCVQNLVGDMIHVHRSTACRVIRRVSMSLQMRLKQYVFLPTTPREITATKVAFQEIGGFPGIVGCVDGTHVRISAPTQNEWEFVNRKGFHSINVQLMCDASLRIINCVVKWPGSTHDSRILSESEVYRYFEESDGTDIILGDSGYAQKFWLMTPFLNPSSPEEERYNRSHIITRNSIERCNGVLKNRFGCLQTCIRMKPSRACTVVCACIVLHNMCTRGDVHPPEVPLPIDNDADVDEIPNEPVNIRGNVVRRQLVLDNFSRARPVNPPTAN